MSSSASGGDEAAPPAIPQKPACAFVLPGSLVTVTEGAGNPVYGEVVGRSSDSLMVRVIDVWGDTVTELETKSVNVVADSHLLQKLDFKGCMTRLVRHVMFLVAQEDPNNAKWTSRWSLLLDVIAEVGASPLLSGLCTSEFQAFAIEEIGANWKTPTIEEAAQWAPTVLNYNCDGIPQGTALSEQVESSGRLGYMVFKSAGLSGVSLGPFVQGPSVTVSVPESSAGRLVLLPITTKASPVKSPSWLLQLIRSISKYGDLARAILELTFEKMIEGDIFATSLHGDFVPELISLLPVGDLTGLIKLCDRVLPEGEKAKVPNNVQQLLLYRMELSVRSRDEVEAKRWRVALAALDAARCFSDLELFASRKLALRESETTILEKKTFRKEIKRTVDFKGASRVQVSLKGPDFLPSWGDYPAPDITTTEEGDKFERTLTFQASDKRLELTGKPPAAIKMSIKGIIPGFDATEPLADFIRSSWKTLYDERIALDLSSGKSIDEIIKPFQTRFTDVPPEFLAARVRLIQVAAESSESLIGGIDQDSPESPLMHFFQQINYIIPFAGKVKRLKTALAGEKSNKPRMTFDRAQDTRALEGDASGKTFFDQMIEQIPIPQIIKLRCPEGPPWEVELAHERGVDAGGPGRDMFSKVCEELMMPQLNLFTLTPNGRNHEGANQKVLIPVAARDTSRFVYVGALLAAAVISNLPQQFRFSRLVWAFLSSGQLHIADVNEIDETFRESVAHIRQCDGPADFDELGSLVPTDWAGNEIVLPKPSFQTRDQFCSLWEKARIDELLPPLSAIKQGFDMLIKPSLMAQFGALEVERLVCGEMDFPMQRMKEILSAGRKNQDDLNKLLEVLEKFTVAERFQFLLFATGQASLPPPGTEETDISMDFKNGSKLPDAHTCSERIVVFRCDSPEQFERNIRIAIEHGVSFELF
jgi:hypothetical protein